MTEYAGESNEEMASCFIISTCQLIPKSISVVSDHMHNLYVATSPVPRTYTISCGSDVEFYIRPLNTCIGDTDALISVDYELAFCDDFPVLPSDLNGLADTIQCYKIEPCHKFPGFVRLRILGEMNYNWKCKEYECNFRPTVGIGLYIGLNMAIYVNEFFIQFPDKVNRIKLTNTASGPAIKSETHHNIVRSDSVKSLFCPQWPTEAKNWPIRPRKYGWPTIDIISEVVQNGCHVVYVQHRSCRDEKRQWRLSFSVAEVILLQSWTQIQQIVYHLLRFFAKKELIQKDCPKEDEVICTYHLKTLMLWTCEEMPSEWWNSSNVIAICCELLKKLLEWLKRRYYPNYFIPEANLFYEPSSSIILDKTERRLIEFHNSGILCQWFVENYILPVIQTYFKVERTLKVMPHFVDCLLPLLEIRKALVLQSLDSLFSLGFTNYDEVCRTVTICGSSSGMRHRSPPGYERIILTLTRQRGFGLISPVIKNELCFTYLDNLFFILHTAHSFSCGEIYLDSGPFVELINKFSMQLKIIRSQHHNFPKAFATKSYQFQFLRAQSLMENLTGLNSRSEFQLLSLVSKECLRRALEYDDNKFNSIAPAALAYLAALHFATSEYQPAIRLCLAVLVDQTSQEGKAALNAGCLLFIDDIARIVGLCVLYKKIANNLHYIGRRLYLDLRLSPNVFAHYITDLSAVSISKRLDFGDLADSAFPMDDYLNALTCVVSIKSGNHLKPARHIVYHRKNSLTKTDTAIMNRLMVKETVIDAVMDYALETMTSFYNVIRKDFGIQCNTVDCYRALYFYKYRNYNELLNLCERILHQPDLPSDSKKYSMANVLVIPPIDSFFDGDIQSLLGFHTLFYCLSPLNDDWSKFKRATDSTFGHWVEKNRVYSLKGKLSKLHLKCFSIKCHYFLGRHFLARYLKVRCCIDCNLPYVEALTEFAAQKTILPFEHIIRRFLLQKLRIIKK